jgi:hypothetical protein
MKTRMQPTIYANISNRTLCMRPTRADPKEPLIDYSIGGPSPGGVVPRDQNFDNN